MLTKDIYHRQINPAASEARLTLIGKSVSWVVVAIMAAIAIYLNSLENKPTLVKLMDMKFDMLMQLGPGFILGMHWRGMKPSAPFLGSRQRLSAGFRAVPVWHADEMGHPRWRVSAWLSTCWWLSHSPNGRLAKRDQRVCLKLDP